MDEPLLHTSILQCPEHRTDRRERYCSTNQVVEHLQERETGTARSRRLSEVPHACDRQQRPGDSSHLPSEAVAGV